MSRFGVPPSLVVSLPDQFAAQKMYIPHSQLHQEVIECAGVRLTLEHGGGRLTLQHVGCRAAILDAGYPLLKTGRPSLNFDIPFAEANDYQELPIFGLAHFPSPMQSPARYRN